jgi:hypothetical protein
VNNWALFTVGACVSAPSRASVLCHFFSVSGRRNWWICHLCNTASAAAHLNPIVCGRSIWLILINYVVPMPQASCESHQKFPLQRLRPIVRARAVQFCFFFWDARARAPSVPTGSSRRLQRTVFQTVSPRRVAKPHMTYFCITHLCLSMW